MNPLSHPALRPGVLALACLASGGAFSASCPQLAASHKFILLRGETVAPDGQKVPLAYCVSRQTGRAVIETLDREGKVQMRARYDGIKSLSNEIIKAGKTIEFSYTEPGAKFTHPKPGEAASFTVSFNDVNQQARSFTVGLKVEKAEPVEVSGCKLSPIRILRQNTDSSGVVVNFSILFSPELNWPVTSETKGMPATQGGSPARPAVLTQMTTIAPAEEAQRICEAAQKP